MNFDELIGAVEFSMDHEVTVSRENSRELSGYVRSIRVCRGKRVCVAYEPYGFDDGGFYFWGDYGSYDELVRDLEEFLALRIKSWQNMDNEYPSKPEISQAMDYASLVAIAKEGKLKLPGNASFEMQ